METEQCNPTRQKYTNCNMERQEKGKGDYKSVIYQKCLEMCWKNKQTNTITNGKLGLVFIFVLHLCHCCAHAVACSSGHLCVLQFRAHYSFLHTIQWNSVFMFKAWIIAIWLFCPEVIWNPCAFILLATCDHTGHNCTLWSALNYLHFFIGAARVEQTKSIYHNSSL